ncbi:MAG: aminoglycoside phosphotransferase family protein [bacterium]
MKQLEKLLDEVYMKKFFQRHLKPFFPRAEKILYFSAKKHNALSSRSFLISYDLDLLYKNGFIRSEMVRGNRVKKDTYVLMAYLWKNFLKKNQYAIPKPLYYFDKINYILYKDFRGEILRDYDYDKNALRITLPLVAKRLAQLHLIRPPKIALYPIDHEAEFLEHVWQKIKDYAPAYQRPYRQIISGLSELERAIYNPKTFVINHDDFQASNIIYDKRANNVGIIDFAFSNLYTPANDVGTFLAHLVTMLNPHFDQKEIVFFQKLFMESYLKYLPQNLKQDVLKNLEIFRVRNALNILSVALSVFLYSTNPKRKLYSKILTRKFLPLLAKDLTIAEQKLKNKLTNEELLRKTSYWQLPKINVNYHY